MMPVEWRSWFLHHAIVAPRPSPAEIEFFFPARRGIGIVKLRWREDDTEFAEQLIEDRVPVGETGEFNTIAVHVTHGCLFAGDNQFAKVAQRRSMAAKELNQSVRVFQGT